MTVLDEAIQFTLRAEGGYYDGSDPRDPNPTMQGVTQKSYDAFRRGKKLPLQTVQKISPEEVRAIYVGYWSPAGCDLVGRLSAITLFDHSINAGQRAAAKVLQRAVRVAADGKLGPASKLAIWKWEANDEELATRICFERIRHYADIAKSPKLRPNLLSWIDRVVLFREAYLR